MSDSARPEQLELAPAAPPKKRPRRSPPAYQPQQRATPIVMLPLPHNVAGLLTPVTATAQLQNMVLAPETRARIERVLVEQAATKKLTAAGFSPMRKLLLAGPPGVGKTMTASVLSSELNIPLLRVNLHAVIASHLGETAAHLAKVFEMVRAMRAVYLFDEFDALAGRRTGGAESDTAEMRRVTNSLLQFIELDESTSLIVAATNHTGLIDAAMFRRFDDVIEFALPTYDETRHLIRNGTGRFVFDDDTVDWDAVSRRAAGVGHADLAAACTRVCKDSVLGYSPVNTESLIAAIADRRAGRAEEPAP